MGELINCFRTETDLANSCDRIIKAIVQDHNLNLHCRYEVAAPGGIPDLVIFNRNEDSLQYLISIEFKLSNWKRAVNQAFRYRNFGNEAYVVLDHAKSEKALDNIGFFKKANVGLITVDIKDNIYSWFLPEPKLPFSSEFAYKIANSLLSPYHPKSRDLPFIRSIRGGAFISILRSIWDS